MERRYFLRGLLAAVAVTAACAVKPPGAEAAPLSPGKLPDLPEPQGLANAITDADEAAALKAENVQYYYYGPRRRPVVRRRVVVRRRYVAPRYYAPPRRVYRRRVSPGVYLRF